MPGDPYLEPELASSALITIDTQRDFTEGPHAIAGTVAAASVTAGVADSFRDASLPIVHMVRLYRDDDSNVDACRRSLIERSSTLRWASICRPSEYRRSSSRAATIPTVHGPRSTTQAVVITGLSECATPSLGSRPRTPSSFGASASRS